MFSDVREYVPGDEARSISWNLTAKMSKPYIRTFEEDREAQILLALDISSSMDFGIGKHSKKSAQNLLASVIAFCAQKNKDRLGLLLFSKDIELYIPPKKGSTHSLRIVREICAFKNQYQQTDIRKAFSFLFKVLKRKTHIFILSDFLTTLPFEKHIGLLGQKHDVVNLVFSDLFERDFPPIGLVDIQDMETGEHRVIDFSAPVFTRQAKQFIKQQTENRNKQFAKSQSELIVIDCQKDIYQPLIKFFKKRAKAV